MRINTSKSKNFTSYSIIKDVTIDGKRTTKIIETNPDKIKCNNENDPKCFIITIASTYNGEK